MPAYSSMMDLKASPVAARNAAPDTSTIPIKHLVISQMTFFLPRRLRPWGRRWAP